MGSRHSAPLGGSVNGDEDPIARNPNFYVRNDDTEVTIGVDCGEDEAACGEDFAQCGNFVDPPGYLLVNKIYEVAPEYLVRCGETASACGETNANCGYYEEFTIGTRAYKVPDDDTKWPYFLYIGGETFGDLAQIDSNRQDEFEQLCLKIKPCQQWLAILVEYN